MSAQLRPFAEWHEDMGDVLWWRFPITEAPYVGSPLDCGFQVSARLYNQFGDEIGTTHNHVGGWPWNDGQENDLYWQAIDVPDLPEDFYPADHDASVPFGCECARCDPIPF